MARVERRRVLVIGLGLAALLVLVVLARNVFWSPTLDDPATLDDALPTEQDMPGYMANRGFTLILKPLPDDKEGRAVSAGEELDAHCEAKQRAWVCEGLSGMGVVGFADRSNVFTRTGSYLLAYDSESAADAAYQELVEATKDELPDSEESPGPQGLDVDDSRTFLGSGTVVVLRIGSVVGQLIVNNDMGQVIGGELDALTEEWATLQTEKVRAALG